MRKHHIKIHFICWTVYIVYEVLMTGTISGRFSHFFTYFFFYVLEISLFYTHALFIMPTSFERSPDTRWRLPILFTSILVIYFFLVILMSYFLDFIQVRRSTMVLNSSFFLAISWRAFLFLIYATGYFFLTRYITKTKEQAQRAIEMEQLRTKLAQLEGDYLRAQIRPHLLFNTLNFVKYAAKHSPAQSDEAILLLSDILSFSIRESHDGMIPIAEELKQVENMIRLNQLRFSNKLQIDYTVQLGSEGIRILPIILLTLVENVFKHGDLTQPDYPAHIQIHTKGETLHVITENLPNNSILPQLRPPGAGLKNIEMRLQEEYGDDGFHFQYGKEGRYYKASLQMPYGERK